jgi:predicted DCC family thiol-disulfide oxidoreductase YuxK
MDSKGSQVILYDGYCNLCNATLQFIIKHDKKKVFQYYALQSKEAKLLLNMRFDDKDIPDSVILLSGGQLYTKSEAMFKILPKLGKGYQLLLILKLFPKKISDYIYDWIAKNRYQWFGKSDQCTIVEN